MDVMLIFDVVIAIFGVYMIGAALKMKKTGKISSAVITAEEIARCRKTKEFIAFIYWKEAVFGALIIAVGVLGIINDKVVSLGAFNVVELFNLPGGISVVPVPAAQGKGTVFIKDSPNHQMAFTGTSHCDDMMSKTGRYLRYEKNTGSR